MFSSGMVSARSNSKPWDVSTIFHLSDFSRKEEFYPQMFLFFGLVTLRQLSLYRHG